MVWRSEVRGRVTESPKSTIEFLQHYMPSCSPHKESTPQNLFDEVPYGDNVKDEKQMYEPLIKAFEWLVSKHDARRRVAFKSKKESWFPSLNSGEHPTRPDLAMSHPGIPWTLPIWKLTSSVFEVKRLRDHDPIATDGKPKPSLWHVETLHQSGNNARNLLASNRGLFVLTIGIYGDTARFFRWDRAGGVVSRPFNYRDRPDLFGEFFWRFVHPPTATPITIAGADPTITCPTAVEREVMKKVIQSHHKDINAEEAVMDGMWVWVPDNDLCENEPLKDWLKNGTRYFTIGAPRFLSTNLFGRATIVWAGLEENGGPKLKVLKDSWRQLCRTPETAFYTRLMGSYGDKIPKIGLPAYEKGGDLGKSGLPEHLTCSAAVRNPGLAETHELSHMRIVLGTVGRPLTEFRSTKELVHALYDAIRGHQVARKAGILHRDISSGNVMLAPEDEKFMGFIHDFDYSSFEDGEEEPIPPLRVEDEHRVSYQGEVQAARGIDDQSKEAAKEIDEERQSQIKEKTGTFIFMAIGILRNEEDKPGAVRAPMHDLESFYWLLLFITLRHTRHSDPRGALACSLRFDHRDRLLAAQVKEGGLSDPVKVYNNKPMTRLLRTLRLLVKEHLKGGLHRLTYAKVLAVFDDVLREDWPKDDAALAFQLPDSRTTDDSRGTLGGVGSKRSRTVSDAVSDVRSRRVKLNPIST